MLKGEEVNGIGVVSVQHIKPPKFDTLHVRSRRKMLRQPYHCRPSVAGVIAIMYWLNDKLEYARVRESSSSVISL